MQFPLSLERSQLPLFEAFLSPLLERPAPPPAETSERCSELTLQGRAGHCLSLLAPILRELSEEHGDRWLTLIAPPESLTHSWLRDAGLNRERILLLQPGGTRNALQLACEALRLGHSHTVVSWLELDAGERRQVAHAARMGDAQSLNIHMA